MELEEETDS